MRLLVDTHILLWWLADDRRLSKQARQLISDPGNTVFVSAASIWEIAIKTVLGRLEIHLDQLEDAVTGSGFQPLFISFSHAVAVNRLPAIHRDPFDRMLTAQSRVEKLRIVSHDEVFGHYGLAAEGLTPILV